VGKRCEETDESTDAGGRLFLQQLTVNLRKMNDLNWGRAVAGADMKKRAIRSLGAKML
jgi:hypothetical protein